MLKQKLDEICSPLVACHMNNQKKKRIIFYGTPAFAATSLSLIVEKGYQVVAVVTAPDKAAGRGLEIQMSDVKKVALALGIQVLQPTNLKSPEFIEQLQNLKPSIQVVIAFRMLPEVVWSLPPDGTFNLHASLLPQYRGAAPINHAIMNGEKTTGVTTFFIEKEIDTGNIILQDTIAIAENDTAGSLHDKLMLLGAQTVVNTLALIESNNVQSIPQPVLTPDEIKVAPKLFPENCTLNFNKTPIELFNFVRGLSPYPAARTSYQQKSYKIFAVEPCVDFETGKIGEWVLKDKKLFIICQNGAIEIKEIQQEGKKRLPVQAFLAGFRLS
jgi:methionyl-tRNA formyltransferase